MTGDPRLFVRIRAVIVLAIVLVAGACEDTSIGPGGGIPCCGNPNPPPPLLAGDIARFTYVANATDNTLSTFLVDANTGRLTPIGYVLTGAGPAAVATDPASKYLYVANRDDDTVSAFVVDEHTGTLSEMADSPYTAGDEPVALLVTPNGNTLYVANRADGSISVLTINATDGSLTARPSAFISGRSPTSLAVDATGSFLFVGNSEINGDPASVSSFAIDSVPAGCLPPTAFLSEPGIVYCAPSCRRVPVRHQRHSRRRGALVRHRR
jgi:DNA-binding beta-propeller fold protein YncE